jgi:hypothetical protein
MFMCLDLKDHTHFPITCFLLHRNSIALLRNLLKNIGNIVLNILINKIISNNRISYHVSLEVDSLCGPVVGVLGYRFGGSGSIPGTTRKKK